MNCTKVTHTHKGLIRQLQQFQGANNGPSNKESQFSAILIRIMIQLLLMKQMFTLGYLAKTSIKNYPSIIRSNVPPHHIGYENSWLFLLVKNKIHLKSHSIEMSLTLHKKHHVQINRRQNHKFFTIKKIQFQQLNDRFFSSFVVITNKIYMYIVIQFGT